MSMSINECKEMIVKISDNEDFKASEIITMLTDLHQIMFKGYGNTITVTLKSISEHMESKTPLTKTDFKSFGEDVLTVLHSDKHVNLTKYNYLPWLHYLRTGEVNYPVGDNILYGVKLNLPGKRLDSETNVDEITRLLKHTGVKNTVLVYGILILLFRR